MSVNDQYDPYRKPSPYDVLGLSQGLEANAKDIGKAYNDEKLKASRNIKDTGERARRIADLDKAKKQLLKPDDRVLLDFFGLSGHIFVELCEHVALRLAAAPPTPTSDLLGISRTERPFDDLLPADLATLEEAFATTEAPEFFLDPVVAERLGLAEISL